jgi:hypothetical protein
MGMGFLAGVFFLRGYEFGQVITSGFLSIAISNCSHHEQAAPLFSELRQMLTTTDFGLYFVLQRLMQ